MQHFSVLDDLAKPDSAMLAALLAMTSRCPDRFAAARPRV